MGLAISPWSLIFCNYFKESIFGILIAGLWLVASFNTNYFNQNIQSLMQAKPVFWKAVWDFWIGWNNTRYCDLDWKFEISKNHQNSFAFVNVTPKSSGNIQGFVCWKVKLIYYLFIENFLTGCHCFQVAN